MDKIGLLTIHNTANYGSTLQAFALCHALAEIGLDAELIDYENETIEARELPITRKPCTGTKMWLQQRLWGKAFEARYDGMRTFLEEHVRFSAPYTRANIALAGERYKGFVLGSDIVWSPAITGGDLTYFFDFVPDRVPKIAFGSSIGNKWDEVTARTVAPLIARFSRVAVREEEAVEWLSELADQEVELVCDPTVLYRAGFWSGFAGPVDAKEPYVLVYMRDPEDRCLRDAKQYAKEHHLRVKYINFWTPVPGAESVKPCTIGTFLGLIQNAQCVFTGSYHGMLFSLCFGRELYYYYNGHPARMRSIAQYLHLVRRNGLDCPGAGEPIDYTQVFPLLEELQNRSWQILRKSCLVFQNGEN